MITILFSPFPLTRSLLIISIYFKAFTSSGCGPVQTQEVKSYCLMCWWMMDGWLVKFVFSHEPLHMRAHTHTPWANFMDVLCLCLPNSTVPKLLLSSLKEVNVWKHFSEISEPSGDRPALGDPLWKQCHSSWQSDLVIFFNINVLSCIKVELQLTTWLVEVSLCILT